MTFLRIVIPLYLCDLSMISAQTRSAFVARENRYPLFRIMVWHRNSQRLLSCPSDISSRARIAQIRGVQTFLLFQCPKMRLEVVNTSCGSVKPAGSRAHDIAGVGLVPLPLRVVLLRHPAVRIGHANDRVVIRRRSARLEG